MKTKLSAIGRIPLIAGLSTFIFSVCVLMRTVSFAQVIAAGAHHSLAICDSGNVQAWGENFYGQLGTGTNDTIGCLCDSFPVQTNTLAGTIAVSAGWHSNALKNDGSVWAWGYNYYGELGDGTVDTTGCFCRPSPIQINALTGIVMIAGGWFHSLALKNDGTVWAWGVNGAGQLGVGDSIRRLIPEQISTLSGITAIAAGIFYSLAVKNDGTVWAWGLNSFGQLGDGTTVNRWTPVQLSTLAGVTAVAGANGHSLALKNDGTVWAWGANATGELGDGTTTQRITPVQVNFLNGMIAIAAGEYHSLALKSNGTVWAWGNNSWGQLGDGTGVDHHIPTLVSSLTGMNAISAGWYHSLALKNDGTLWSWGGGSEGQLGDGNNIDRASPVQVLSLCTIATGLQAEPSVMHNEFLITPTLTTGELTITLPQNVSETTINIYNLLGEKVFSQTTTGNQQTINVTKLTPGIYFVKVRSEKEERVVKFVKE